MPDGALLVSDDRAGAIYRITYAEEVRPLTPPTPSLPALHPPQPGREGARGRGVSGSPSSPRQGGWRLGEEGRGGEGPRAPPPGPRPPPLASGSSRSGSSCRRRWRGSCGPSIRRSISAPSASIAALPHLTRLLGSEAVNIPALCAPPHPRLRDSADCDPGASRGSARLLHEAYHALQAQETGWGLGPFRPFLMLYFARGAANRFRYHGHPMEEDAYRVAGRRHSPLRGRRFPTGRGTSRLWRKCRDLAVPVERARASGRARPGPARRSSSRLVGEGPIGSLPSPSSLLPLPWPSGWLTWSLAAALAWLGSAAGRG